mgnify:CR=1 FL=1
MIVEAKIKANRLLSLNANLYPRYMRQMNMAIIKKTPKKPFNNDYFYVKDKDNEKNAREFWKQF